MLCFFGTGTGHRLVEKQQGRLRCKRQRQFQKAALTMRQIGDRRCRPVAEANPVKHHARAFDQCLIIEGGPEKPEGLAAPRLLGKDGVLEDREIHQHIADLEGAANATRNPLWHVEAVHHLTAEFDNAGVGRFRSVDLADQCRFAGTVRADQRVNFAMCDIK